MHIGEIAALGTALCWTVSALVFEVSTRRVGSLAVNIYKLCFALVFLGTFCAFRRGLFLPVDASPAAWFWLGLSGIIGFSVGDIFLFAAYPLIGSRIAALAQALVPALTAIIGFVFLGERLSALNLAGMVLVMGGITLVVTGKTPAGDAHRRRGRTVYSPRGLLYTFLGALGQAVGLILSKRGLEDGFDPFAATEIRVIAGIAGFALMATVMRRWKPVLATVKDGKALKCIVVGSIFGPALGVALSLVAVRYTTAGAASTIMALEPVFLIAPAVLILKQKTNLREITGAVIATGGVALFFL